MKVFVLFFLGVSLSFASELDAIYEIDWHEVYGNVNNYMVSEGKGKSFDRHINEVEFYLSDYGYQAMYAIAVIETSLRGDINTKVGDYTIFQINGYWWQLAKLGALSGVDNLTKQDVRDNPANFAAHILVYNFFEALRKRKVQNLCEALTVYHQPYRVSKDYYRKAERYYKGCGEVRYASFVVD
jgi:hypothetical protein